MFFLDWSGNKFGKCFQRVGKKETPEHHSYTTQIKQRSFSHIISRADVNLGRAQFDFLKRECADVGGGEMGSSLSLRCDSAWVISIGLKSQRALDVGNFTSWTFFF